MTSVSADYPQTPNCCTGSCWTGWACRPGTLVRQRGAGLYLLPAGRSPAGHELRHDKATKLLVELDGGKGFGLIERVRQGQGRPTKIYVKRFTTRTVPEPPTLSEVRGADIGFPISRPRKNRCLDLDESDALTSEKPTQVILNPIKRILFILIHPSIHSPPYRPADG